MEPFAARRLAEADQAQLFKLIADFSSTFDHRHEVDTRARVQIEIHGSNRNKARILVFVVQL